MDRRNISGPKRAQDAIRSLLAFCTVLHTHTHLPIEPGMNSALWPRLASAPHGCPTQSRDDPLPFDRRFDHALSLRARLTEV